MKNKQVEPPRYRFGDSLQTLTHRERVCLKRTLFLWGLLGEPLNRLATIVARRLALGDSLRGQKSHLFPACVLRVKAMRVLNLWSRKPKP